MNKRLKQIVQYKTGGRQRDFAALMGWTPQYLAKLLRGESFGLVPVQALLEALPEINARWLLIGKGEMLVHDKMSDLRREGFAIVQNLLHTERYIPVMTPDELNKYESALAVGRIPSYSEDTIMEWELRLAARNKPIEDAVNEAMKKSNELCKARTAKKS